ncbi:MAG: hypothetical protein E6G67_02455 [Actinobacteria bacterium]|nr:MAG: hypothetical protein E6G67_02455 [Actinomycetota bacterium]
MSATPAAGSGVVTGKGEFACDSCGSTVVVIRPVPACTCIRPAWHPTVWRPMTRARALAGSP